MGAFAAELGRVGQFTLEQFTLEQFTLEQFILGRFTV